MKLRVLLLGTATFALGLAPPTLRADIFTFGCITNNSGACGPIANQMSVDVTAVGANQVSFKFMNAGPLPSSITDIFFDDGTLLGIASIVEGPGTQYSFPANNNNLPGGNNVSPPFVATAGFSADPDPPAQPNGVNPGEFVSIIFDLLPGATFAQTLAAITGPLGDGNDLRMGIHVQGLLGGFSEAMVNGGGPGGPPPPPPPNPVPEPASVVLFGTALLGACLYMRKRRTA